MPKLKGAQDSLIWTMTPYLKPKKVLTSSTPKVISFFLQHLDPNLLFATTKQLYVSLNYPHVTYPPLENNKGVGT